MGERLEAQRYIDGILRGDRAMLARAITVVESELEASAAFSECILEAILPYAGKSQRVGITGAPGVGKSTFIDALGLHLIRDRAERVAVLSVDPSSPFSGGSILGDKTRMQRLAAEANAFIRPSPARGHPGGVSRHTREGILLCEAAGYQNILVETVGVGQSETAVRSMTDFFLLLISPGGGDELQGMKRGIIEMVDGIAINKADGENEAVAEGTRTEYVNALRLFPAGADDWSAEVRTVSSLTGKGIAEIWDVILRHRRAREANGSFAQNRSAQALKWMRELVFDGMQRRFQADPDPEAKFALLERGVETGDISPCRAAREFIAAWFNERR